MYSKRIMLSNQRLGRKTENEFAEYMHGKGYWVYLLPLTHTGQPFDVIIAKNENTWFLDIKHVKDKDYILHSRFEANQVNTFNMLSRRGIVKIGFVVKFSKYEGWFLLLFNSIDFAKTKTYIKDMVKI